MNQQEWDKVQQALALINQGQSILASLEPLPEPTLPSSKPSRTLAWGNKVSAEFRNNVFWIADDLLIDASSLMSCMAFETGERFTADVKNPSSSATGLIQFMSFTAKALGTTTAALAKMTAEDQLNYVWKYFAQWPKGSLKTLEDIYMAILYPKAIGKPLDYKMFVKGDSNYGVNAGLDKNKDNVVTKAEAANKVMEKYAKGIKPPFVWEGTEWHT